MGEITREAKLAVSQYRFSDGYDHLDILYEILKLGLKIENKFNELEKRLDKIEKEGYR